MTGERGFRVTAEEKTGPGRGAGSEGHGSVQWGSLPSGGNGGERC